MIKQQASIDLSVCDCMHTATLFIMF